MLFFFSCIQFYFQSFYADILLLFSKYPKTLKRKVGNKFRMKNIFEDKFSNIFSLMIAINSAIITFNYTRSRAGVRLQPTLSVLNRFCIDFYLQFSQFYFLRRKIGICSDEQFFVSFSVSDSFIFDVVRFEL